nr:PREDICTED: protein NLRC5 isoform X2 [Anolis carolinensis]|eukprot:XP_016854758.1 PREDICTED: protein NLRC5 isoform X2 [Anolis carolinensis]
MMKMDDVSRQRAIDDAWPQLVDFLDQYPEWVLRKARQLLPQRDLSCVEDLADPKEKVSLVLDAFRTAAEANPPAFKGFVQSACMEFNLPMEIEITFMSISAEAGFERRRPWSSPSAKHNCKASKQQRLDSAERYRQLVVQHMRQRYGTSGPFQDQPSAFNQAFINLVIRHCKALKLKGRTEKGVKEEHTCLHDMEEHGNVTMRLSDLFDSVQTETTKVILLLGRPGMGKTRLMHKICQQWAEGNLTQFQLIFLFEFRQLNLIKRKLTLQELFFGFFLQPDSCPDAVFEQLQEDARHILVIFDGLDEFVENIELSSSPCVPSPDLFDPLSTAELFVSLCYGKLLSGCTVLVTTRPKVIPESLSKVRTLLAEIWGFDREKVEEYASYYFRHNSEKEQALAYLKSNGKLLSMCYIPALCNIVCICLEYLLLQNPGSNQLPQTVTEFYIQMLSTTICKHRDKEEHLGQHQEALLGLCEWAFKGLEQKKMLFYAGEVPEQVKDFACQHGLLLVFEVRTSSGHTQAGYTFIHFILQEFLAALFLLTSKNVDGKCLKEKFFLRSKWTLKKGPREPFTTNCHVFLSGLSSKECQGFLSSLSGQTKTWVRERQTIVLEVLKKLAVAHLTGPKIVELCHCVYETQDLELAKHVGERLNFTFQFRNFRLMPLDMMALAFVINSSAHLVCLDFIGCSMELDYLDVLGSCENIQSLSFRSRKYGNEFADVLSKSLPKMKHLTTFRLTGGNITISGLEHLMRVFPNCQQLEDINLQDNKLKAQDMVKLTEIFPMVNKLRKMDLSFNESSVDAILALVKVAVTCPNVTKLLIRKDTLLIYFTSQSRKDPRLKGVEIKAEETIPQARSLILRLQECQLDPRWAKPLADILRTCPHFSEIDLSDNPLGDAGCNQLMKTVPKLSISGPLRLNNNQLTLKSLFRLLNTMAFCPNIVMLKASIYHQTATLTFINKDALGATHSRDFSWHENPSSHDGEQGMNTSRKICLADNKLHDAGNVKKLCLALKQCSSVSEIDLSNNSLGDMGVLKVAQLLPDLKALRSLTLDGNQLSLDGAFQLVEYFSSLKHMTLMQLSLGRNQTIRLTFGGQISLDNEHQGETWEPAMGGRRFSLTDCNMGPDDIDRLFRILITCSDLGEINLYGNMLKDQEMERLLAFLPHLKTLKLLCIKEKSFSPRSLLFLVSSLHLSERICEVEVRSNTNAFLHFMDNPESQETSCRLTGCGLGQADVEELCDVLKKCDHLAELDLSRNNLGNEGLKLLLQHFPKALTSCLVRLSHNQVSQDGVLHLIHIFSISQKIAQVHVSLCSMEMLLITFVKEEKPQKSLRLTQCNFQAEHLDQLCIELGKCTSLTDFTSTNNGLMPSNAEDLFRVLRKPAGTLRISIEEPWVEDGSISALLKLAAEAEGNISGIKKDGPLFVVEQEFPAQVEKVEAVVSRFHQCEVDAKESHFLRKLAEKCKQLRALNCSRVDFADEEAEATLNFLLNFPALERLDFSKSKLTTDGIATLFGSLEGKSQLRSINLSFLNLDDTYLPKLILGLSAMPLLRKLSLNNNRLSSDACPFLAEALKKAINMEEIDLSYNKLDDAGVKEIASALPEMKNLKQINLLSNNIGTAGGKAFGEALAASKNLEVLRLSGNSLGNETLEKLAPVLPSLHHLKVLHLSSCGIDYEGVVHLSKHLVFCPQIEEISLSENSIGYKGAMVLIEHLPPRSQLKKIELKACNIGDGAFKMLAFRVSRCPLIEEITLSWNELSDKSAADLAKVLPRMARLRILDLDHNCVTAIGAEKLAEGLIRCREIQAIRLWHNLIPKAVEQKLSEREPKMLFSFV